MAKIITIETDFGTFATLEDDLITRQITKFSAHTRNELAMFLSFLREGDVILDIGAHIGTFAIPIAITLQQNCAVYAFEPQRRIFEILQDNVKRNELSDAVTAINGIVCDDPNADFTVFTCEGNTGATQFLRRESTVEDLKGSKVKTPIVNIDEMIVSGTLPETVDAIKIDTEGAELSVLKSCERLIRRCKPLIYCEICPETLAIHNTHIDDLAIFLRKHGYMTFKNIGERNSTNDFFEIARLRTLNLDVDLFDVIAFHKASVRKPKKYVEYPTSGITSSGRAKRAINRVQSWARDMLGK